MFFPEMVVELSVCHMGNRCDAVVTYKNTNEHCIPERREGISVFFFF